MQKIIFLDFDGVITTMASRYKLDQYKCDLLQQIIDRTGAKIVVSSSWRSGSAEETIAALKAGKHVIADKPLCTSLEQLDEIEWGSDSHAECILELFVRALVNAFHQRQGIVYDDVYIFVLGEDFRRKCFEYLFFANIADEMVARLFVNQIYLCSVCAELVCYAFANAFCSASYNYYLVFKYLMHILLSLFIVMQMFF